MVFFFLGKGARRGEDGDGVGNRGRGGGGGGRLYGIRAERMALGFCGVGFGVYRSLTLNSSLDVSFVLRLSLPRTVNTFFLL